MYYSFLIKQHVKHLGIFEWNIITPTVPLFFIPCFDSALVSLLPAPSCLLELDA